MKIPVAIRTFLSASLLAITACASRSLLRDHASHGCNHSGSGCDAGGSCPELQHHVYYGDPGEFVSPAEVDADCVFAAIPEFREIESRCLERNQVAYHSLIEKANQKFFRAIWSVAMRGRFDLVCEWKALSRSGRNVPDITKQVVAALRR